MRIACPSAAKKPVREVIYSKRKEKKT